MNSPVMDMDQLETLLERLTAVRVLAVGDAFATDVAGAQAAGLNCLFCSGGIHAEELGTVYGQMPDPVKMETAIAQHGDFRPTAAIGGFIW